MTMFYDQSLSHNMQLFHTISYVGGGENLLGCQCNFRKITKYKKERRNEFITVESLTSFTRHSPIWAL